MSIKVLGLTGPSGAGKGTAATLFAKYGIPSIDTDAVYHTLLREDGALNAELANAFGTSILGENGRVERKRLAAAVFGQENTPALLHTLNTITHKYVMSEVRSRLHALEQVGVRTVILDAPQLFEAGADLLCDAIIGIVASRALRLTRIMARDGIDETAALARLDAQKSDEFFSTHCDRILENNSDKKALVANLDAILSELGV